MTLAYPGSSENRIPYSPMIGACAALQTTFFNKTGKCSWTYTVCLSEHIFRILIHAVPKRNDHEFLKTSPVIIWKNSKGPDYTDWICRPVYTFAVRTITEILFWNAMACIITWRDFLYKMLVDHQLIT